jgi:hypothetical protein
MDLDVQHEIAGKLEASKSEGWLSDYLVAWHGSGGELSPSVTIWRAGDLAETDVVGHVSQALAGLVASASIFLADS